jgi:hypothetical protein
LLDIIETIGQAGRGFEYAQFRIEKGSTGMTVNFDP